MKKVLLGVFFALILVGCTSAPVLIVVNEQVPTLSSGASPTLAEAESAILNASQKRGWSPKVVKPGLIVSSLAVRAHKATVEISYNTKSYSINYKSSENLNYDDGEIHRNYNNWVKKLSGTIQQEFGVRTQKY